MSKTIPIVTCDVCNTDITTTGNCEDYRLVLTSESKTPWYVAQGERGGFVTAMAISPPIAQPLHFCGLECLWRWAAEAKALAAERRAESNRWVKRVICGVLHEPPPNGWPLNADGLIVDAAPERADS